MVGRSSEDPQGQTLSSLQKKTDIPLWFFILYVCTCLNFVFRMIAVNFGGLLLVTPYYAAPTEYISRPPCY